MALLVTKNDFVEVVCKFKGHIVNKSDVQYIREHPDETRLAVCKRCNFQVLIKMDPDDDDYYLISDAD